MATKRTKAQPSKKASTRTSKKPPSKARATRTQASASDASARETFRAVVGVGHKETHYVLVPFDPRVKWRDIEPVKIPRPQDPRGGKGWLITGTLNGVPFDGHIGQRYGSTYLIVERPLLAMAKASEGDSVDVDVAPLAIVAA